MRAPAEATPIAQQNVAAIPAPYSCSRAGNILCNCMSLALAGVALGALAVLPWPPGRRAAAGAAATAKPAPVASLIKPVDIPYRELHAAQRPARDRPHRSQGADRRGDDLVPSRLEARADGQDRLRPSLRASDLRRLGECAERFRRAARSSRRDRLNGTTWYDRTNYVETVPTARSTWRCSWKATAWATCSAR